MKKILVSLMAILLAVGLVGAGAFAYFNDTETSTGNTFTAGTLDLTVDGQNDPNVVSFQVSTISPGWSQKYKWVLKNIGSITGKVFVEFSPITNNENLVTEPEAIAEAQPYAYFRPSGSTLGDPVNGELGQYLKFALLKWDGFNHWGPGTDDSGPATSWGTWGLNKLGGNTYDTGLTLAPGETLNLYLGLTLESNLTAWDGCWSHDIDDNVIQSDGVVFNIIFHLVQVP